MLIVTTNDVPGYRVVKTLGLVRGITVRSRNVISDAIGGLQSMLGGRVGTYVKLAEASRAEAYDELVQHAHVRSPDPGPMTGRRDSGTAGPERKVLSSAPPPPPCRRPAPR